jgi:hypothetical protein
LRELRFRDELRFREELFFRGTFFPFARASERPIAIACLRDFALPRRPRPALSFQRLYLCIARFTSLAAPRLYFRRLDFFLAAMVRAPCWKKYADHARVRRERRRASIKFHASWR